VQQDDGGPLPFVHDVKAQSTDLKHHPARSPRPAWRCVSLSIGREAMSPLPRSGLLHDIGLQFPERAGELAAFLLGHLELVKALSEVLNRHLPV